MPPNDKLSKIGRAVQEGFRRAMDALVPPPQPRPTPALVPAVVTPRRPVPRRDRYWD